LIATITSVSRSTACSGLQPRWVRPSFPLGDTRRRIGLRHPVGVGQRLVLARAIEADQGRRGRRFDAARPGQTAQHLLVILAAVPAHQTAQRGIGLLGRGIHADPPGRHQVVLVRDLQDQAEHGMVDFQRQPRAGDAQRGVVGHALALDQPQEAVQRQRIGAAPFDLALGVQALELADEQHPEVPPRRD
jgi:hypothetical protein